MPRIHRWDRKALLANAFGAAGARVIAPVLNAILVIGIARSQGAGGLGQYTLLITLFLLFENLKSLGLNTFVVREIGREPRTAAEHFSSLVWLGIVGAAVSSLGITLIAALFGASVPTLAGAVAVCCGLFPSAYVVANEALFLATGYARHLFAVAFVESALRVLASFGVLYFMGGNVAALVAVYSLSRLVAAMLGGRLRAQCLGVKYRPVALTALRGMISHAPSFMVIFTLPLVLFKMDILFLGMLSGDHAVGLYGAATRVVAMLIIVPDGILSAMFAPLSHFGGADDRLPFQSLLDRSMTILGVGTVAGALGIQLLAPYIVGLLYGAEFVASTRILQILICSLPFLVLNRLMGDALVAIGQQRRVARSVALAIVPSAAFYYASIASWGVEGAAWAFVASVVLTYALQVREAVSSRAILGVWRLLMPSLPAACLVIVAWLWSQDTVYAAVGASINGIVVTALLLCRWRRWQVCDLDREGIHEGSLRCDSNL